MIYRLKVPSFVLENVWNGEAMRPYSVYSIDR